MNHKQVAKVTHEALRALGETTGEASAAPKKWEDLTEHERDQQVQESQNHAERRRNRVNQNDVADPLPEPTRLKYHIAAGISDGFARYEDSIRGPFTLVDEGSEELQRHQTVSPDLVRARNAKLRQDLADQKESRINDALKKADADAAEMDAPLIHVPGESPQD